MCLVSGPAQALSQLSHGLRPPNEEGTNFMVRIYITGTKKNKKPITSRPRRRRSQPFSSSLCHWFFFFSQVLPLLTASLACSSLFCLCFFSFFWISSHFPCFIRLHTSHMKERLETDTHNHKSVKLLLWKTINK